MTPIQVVGVAIIRTGDAGSELLAARRIEPPELAGGWELPGGKVDPGESVQQTAHREIDEELGVAISLGDEIPPPHDSGWPLGDAYRMRVFLAHIVDDAEPQPLQQHDSLQWVSLADWRTVDWLPGDLDPVQAVVEYLR